MSIDSWGGGSDEDPKLRLKELKRSSAKRANTRAKKRPAITMLEIVVGVIVVSLMLLGYALKR